MVVKGRVLASWPMVILLSVGSLAAADIRLVEAVKARGAPVDWARLDEPSYGDIQATGVLTKARRPNAARLFSNYLVSKEGQQKLAELSNVVVRKDVEPKIALDRSKLRVIDPAEGNRLDYYMGLINELFVKPS